MTHAKELLVVDLDDSLFVISEIDADRGISSIHDLDLLLALGAGDTSFAPAGDVNESNGNRRGESSFSEPGSFGKSSLNLRHAESIPRTYLMRGATAPQNLLRHFSSFTFNVIDKK